jgi:hypothetical protein
MYMSNQDKNSSQPSETSGKSIPADPSNSVQFPRSEPESRPTLFVESIGRQTGIVCPKCNHVNRPGILVCENCGTLLVNDTQANDEKPATKRFESDKTTVDDAEQTYRQASETSELVSAAMSSAGSTQFTENMVLRLEIDGAPTPILLHPKAETSIGRRDPATGTMPDVDLSAYAGYRLGVSRKHAFIRLKNHQLEMYDLGSSNGTSVNGVRLTAHQPHVLRDGDEILLGKMVIRVLFQVRNRRK